MEVWVIGTTGGAKKPKTIAPPAAPLAQGCYDGSTSANTPPCVGLWRHVPNVSGCVGFLRSRTVRYNDGNHQSGRAGQMTGRCLYRPPQQPQCAHRVTVDWRQTQRRAAERADRGSVPAGPICTPALVESSTSVWCRWPSEPAVQLFKPAQKCSFLPKDGPAPSLRRLNK